jgi:hypothetical protein
MGEVTREEFDALKALLRDKREAGGSGSGGNNIRSGKTAWEAPKTSYAPETAGTYGRTYSLTDSDAITDENAVLSKLGMTKAINEEQLLIEAATNPVGFLTKSADDLARINTEIIKRYNETLILNMNATGGDSEKSKEKAMAEAKAYSSELMAQHDRLYPKAATEYAMRLGTKK